MYLLKHHFKAVMLVLGLGPEGQNPNPCPWPCNSSHWPWPLGLGLGLDSGHWPWPWFRPRLRRSPRSYHANDAIHLRPARENSHSLHRHH